MAAACGRRAEEDAMRRLVSGLAGRLVLVAAIAAASTAGIACSGHDDDDDRGGPTPATGEPAPASATAASGGTKNERWVRGFCVAAQAYVDDLGALSDDFDVPSSSSPSDIKKAMVAFIGEARDRSATLKRDIDRLGDPDVKDGKKIQSAMSQAAGTIVALFDDSLDDARDLDDSDRQELQLGLERLGTDLSEAADQLNAAFAQIDVDYDTEALSEVATGIEECAGIF
jgi:hypothetical protein